MARRASTWNRRSILAAIRERAARGRSLAAHGVRNSGRSGRELCFAGREHFGEWYKAVEAAGIAYPIPIRRRANWTRDEVIRQIKARRRAGQPLGAAAAGKAHPALLRHARELFGDWEGAVTAAGLDYARIRHNRRWTGALIAKTIRDRHAAGRPISYRLVQTEEGGIIAACNRFFGSYGEAVEAAGIDYGTVITRNREWTRKLLIAELRRLADDIRAGVDDAEAERRREAMRRGCRRLAKDWPRMVKAAGLTPHDFYISHAQRMSRLFAREREPWSEAETARFKLLVRNGTPALAIAIHLARSGTALVAKARELNMKLSPHRD